MSIISSKILRHEASSGGDKGSRHSASNAGAGSPVMADLTTRSCSSIWTFMNSASGSAIGGITVGANPSPSTVAGTSTMAPSGRFGTYPRLRTFTALMLRAVPVHMAPMAGNGSSAERPARCMGTWDSPLPYRVTNRSTRAIRSRWK